MKRTGPTNPILNNLIKELKNISIKDKVNLWKRVAKELEKPTRQRRSVNLSRINRYAKEGEDVIVPGKVLSSGSLNKKINIVSYSFSESALDKINSSGSKAILLKDYIKQNPKGSNTRIIG